MNYRWLFLLMFCLFPENIWAQTDLLAKKVSLHYTNQPLAAILTDIQQNYHIPFSYFNNQVSLQNKISITLKEVTLQTVLDQLLKPVGITYQAISGQIVLKNQVISQPTRQQKTDKQFLFNQNQVNDTDRNASEENFLFVSGEDNLLFHPSLRKLKMNVKQPGTKVRKQALLAQKTSKPGKLFLPGKGINHLAISNSAYDWKDTLEHLKLPLTFLTSTAPALIRTVSLLKKLLPSPPVKSVYTNSKIQLALVPGISTHGIHPGEYVNNFSLNILAGYSAGNNLVELGGLSNFNQNQVYGLQLAGLANVVGGNQFVGLSQEEKQKQKKEAREANLQGVQVAGITNIIAGNVYGWQTAGGINLAKKSLQGVQIAGVSNVVNTFSFGIQLAGISNAAMESVDGLQIAGLYNYTEGELHGIQISAFNQAGIIEGNHSRPSAGYSGLQFGLLNTARRMNGYQIGLVNIGGNMSGIQVGLININSNKKPDGLPIGLLNLNSKGEFIRLYTSELFLSNLEISTGSLRIQNMLSVGYNPIHNMNTHQPKWNVGYSIGKVHKPNSTFFYSYDAGISHINQAGKLTKELSLLTKVRGTAGFQVHLGKIVFHLFGGLTFNTFLSGYDTKSISPIWLRLYDENNKRMHIEMWPGFVAGIHI